MAGQPDKAYPLTQHVESQILAALRAGAFPHVAAEAAGIPGRIFDDWMRLGRPRKGTAKNKKWYPFFIKITQGQAQARLVAEMKTFQRGVWPSAAANRLVTITSWPCVMPASTSLPQTR